MGVYSGPADWWTDNADSGRIHVSTKGVVQSGLVLNLDAGASTSYPGSNTTWTDLSGNGNNGTLTNSPTFSSNTGGYFSFDGTNDYVGFTYVQPSYSTTTSFTWSIWVYATRNNNQDVLMGIRGTDLDFTKLTTNNFEYYPTVLGGAMPTNVWQNTCVVKNETNLYYYRDTVLVANTTSSTTKPSKAFYIGGDPSAAPTEYSTARIAVVSVYNRALTLAEIQQNFNAMRGRFGI